MKEHYILDVESTGRDPIKNDIIEISIIRYSTKEQQTFNLKPLNKDSIEIEALKVNKYTIEEIMNFEDPKKVIPKIENFLLNDDKTANERVIVGHNVEFDIKFLIELWNKCDTKDSYPFSYHYLDTKQIAMYNDFIFNSDYSERYSLNKLIERYGIKKQKLHRAESDTKMTLELFNHLISESRNLIK